MGSPTADAGETGIVDAYQYTESLTLRIRQACADQGRDEISQWCLEHRREREALEENLEEKEDANIVGALEEHVCTVLATSGVTDFGARERMVEAAVMQVERRRRAKLQKEKVQKEKEKEKAARSRATAEQTTDSKEKATLSHAKTGPMPKEEDKEQVDRRQGSKESSFNPVARSKTTSCERTVKGSKDTTSLSSIAAAFASAVAPQQSPFAKGATGDSPDAVRAAEAQGWKEVQSFKTQEEAVRFVMACQPFDYQPAREPKEHGRTEEPFPRWGSGREAFEWVMQNMKPLPSEFVSISTDCERKLRIREASEEEIKRQKEQEIRTAVQASSRLPARERTSVTQRSKNSTLLPKVRAALATGQVTVATTKELKPWIVEAAGTLFQRPASLRNLVHESALTKSGSGGSLGAKTVYYIAVAPAEEKQILQEGYRVKRRVSIPCSSTPKDAIAAFNRHAATRPAAQVPPPAPGADLRENTAPSVKVLVVTLPPELGIDVVAHRNGGFLIRCKELPPRCFKRLNKPSAAAE